MTKTRTALRLAAIGACSGFVPVHAHHSYGMFDRCKPTTLEGEINSVDWVNPHIVIDLRTRDVESYRVEWFSPGQLERESIATETLEPGDRVTITGHAMRDPNLKVLSLLSEIRAANGWIWKRDQRIPENCPTG
jgi:hypothetical protein